MRNGGTSYFGKRKEKLISSDFPILRDGRGGLLRIREKSASDEKKGGGDRSFFPGGVNRMGSDSKGGAQEKRNGSGREKPSITKNFGLRPENRHRYYASRRGEGNFFGL